MKERRESSRTTNRILVALVELVLLLLIPGSAPAQSGPTEDHMAFLLYGRREKVDAAVGPAVIAGIERSQLVYSDPRVDRIAARLQTSCPRKNIRVRVVQSPVVNAVSVPGGAIYICSALLDAVGSDDDALAAVIAHEMGHASRYHAIEKWRRLISAAGAVQQVRPDQAALFQLGGEISVSSVARDQEREADNDGIRFLVRGGFDPEGMFRMLDLLREQPRSHGAEWLQSHPSPKNRSKRLRGFMRNRAQRPYAP
jgi:predicted Zn-dependent protease